MTMEADDLVSKGGNLSIPHTVRKEDPAKTVEVELTGEREEVLNGMILKNARRPLKNDMIPKIFNLQFSAISGSGLGFYRGLTL